MPYKRGVRTTSVNQRYLTHEQTFDAGFVRSPAPLTLALTLALTLTRTPNPNPNPNPHP